MGTIRGAAGARDGCAFGAGAGARGRDLGRADPAGDEATLGHPRAAERLGIGVASPNTVKSGEREGGGKRKIVYQLCKARDCHDWRPTDQTLTVLHIRDAGHVPVAYRLVEIDCVIKH